MSVGVTHGGDLGDVRRRYPKAPLPWIDLSTGIVLFFVRFVIVMTPVLVFVILPLGVVALYFKRRAVRIRLANQLEANPATD